MLGRDQHVALAQSREGSHEARAIGDLVTARNVDVLVPRDDDVPVGVRPALDSLALRLGA